MRCLEAAILGFIGVIVGGLLTGGVQLFLDWRKERRSARQAKRLVQGELLNAELILGTLANLPSKTWPSFLDVNAALPTSAWLEHRAQLAEILDADLWDRLILAYAGLEADRVRLMTAKDLPPLAEPEITGLRESVLKLQALRHALGGKGVWREDVRCAAPNSRK